MNISRSNWINLLPLIQSKLSKADFVAIDFEMTGILSSSQLRNSQLDSMQLRYWKTKENVKRFLPIQMGICSFHILDGGRIEAAPFNIYLYPFAAQESLDRMFLFSTSSINFLSNYQFDFNRTFYDGVYFMSRESEALYEQQKMLTELRNKMRQTNRITSPDMLAYAQVHIESVKYFFSKPEIKELHINIKFVLKRNYEFLLEQVKRVADDEKYYVTYDNEIMMKRTMMTINRGCSFPEEMEKGLLFNYFKQVQESQDPEPDIIGVRRLIDQIIEQKTPLILHNGFTDLCHLYDKFMYSLPERQEDFKTDLRKLFPLVYDTKFIINSTNLLFSETKQNSMLKNSYDTLKNYQQKNPIISIDSDFQEYKIETDNDNLKSFEHEAGYDAFMTGYVFFKALSLIQHGPLVNDQPFTINHERLKYYANRFPLGSVRLPFNLEDVDDRYHEKQTEIFYMTFIQKQLIKDSDIKQYFKDMGFDGINLFLSYGMNYEYFMTFCHINDAILFKQKLKAGSIIINIDGQDVVISAFENYQEQLKRKVKDELEIRSMPTCLEKEEIK